ncbi:MAG: hypothetical protein SCH70_13165 [Candidatus Methanoperedens sp.]|nr:hypothetical protein [Candidatus Methanoperedens sp.]
MKLEKCYSLSIYAYSYPLELFGRIFYLIFRELWQYLLIAFIPFILITALFSLNIYYSVIRFILYASVALLMIVWHEFGHVIMIIHENFGIVNIGIRFTRKGLFTFPSIIHHGGTIETSNIHIITLGGVVATLIFNPLINVIIYIVMLNLLPKKVIPNILFFVAVPFINLVEYFHSEKHSDIYILKSLYGLKTYTNGRFRLIKDILYTMKNILYYCIGKTRYYSDKSLSKLIPIKIYNHGLWLENRIIVASPNDKENNDLKSISIEKKDINIWFSINNKRTIKDIVDKYGLESLQILVNFREKNLIELYYNDLPASNTTAQCVFKRSYKINAWVFG